MKRETNPHRLWVKEMRKQTQTYATNAANVKEMQRVRVWR